MVLNAWLVISLMSASLLAALAVRSLIMARPQSQKPKQPKNAVSTANGAVTAPGANGNSKPVAQFQQSTFSGPMPPPSVLEGYERLVKGAAERILIMAESDAKHQQEIEFAALRAMEAEVKRGQFFGFVIGLTALGASMLALAMGSPAVAGVIGGTTVIGLVSVFIVGRVVKPD
ncbi:MAG: hypothetical protein A2Z65_04685 [Gallionellales bacterium RIFCSPLOWO2_02_58_13]|nr:MAG: hypothetical protein A2Z65_04685 [Gallionellales bacterium RIFCSPLOWO2_02_58_13]